MTASKLQPAFAILLLTAALLLPALWNGYPLLYFDTKDYVTLAQTGMLPIYRTAGYAYLAWLGPAAGTLWPVIVAQSAIVAYVLYESHRLLTPGLLGWRLAATLAVVLVLSSLPWVTSEIMPDVYTAPAVLLTLLLALHGDTVGRARWWTWVVLLGIAGLSHPTHIAVLAGLAVCVTVITWLARRGAPFVPMQVSGILAGIVLGFALSLLANWHATGRVFFAPRTTPVLTLAVLLENGLGQRYLQDTCGHPGVHQSALCPFRDELPTNANQFLWHDQNFWKAGGWNGMIPRAAEDVAAIARRYPLAFVMSAAKLMSEQLVTVRTGEGFRTMFGFIDGEIRKFYPGDFGEFAAARQQRYPDILDSPMPRINQVHVPVALACAVLLCGLVAFAIHRHMAGPATIGGLILLAYLGNAFLCGAVSNPADRYGSRMAWLVVAATAAFMFRPFSPGGQAARERSSAAD